jgi:serine/threonine-protein kinase RsbW
MSRTGAEHPEEQLKLRGRLSEAAQLPAWIENLASLHAIPTDVQFAINLCLEEALANSIRHGYGGETDRPLIVRFMMPRERSFVFAVDDEAPQFNPLIAPELPALNPHEEIRVGGQGIRLLRRFADALEYEPTPTGNRLKMSFSTGESTAPP